MPKRLAWLLIVSLKEVVSQLPEMGASFTEDLDGRMSFCR
jgi:hypothetical protein